MVDDLHRASDDQLSLSFLGEFVPECLHKLVLISRPNAAISTFISRHTRGTSAQTVGKAQLAFTEFDVSRILARECRQPADASTVLRLTDGCPAAVHFAVAALGDSKPVASLVDSLDGSAFHNFATRYFQHLERERQLLLLDLALAGSFDTRLLVELECGNGGVQWLFASSVPIQISNTEYRLHDLFADLVRAQMGEKDVKDRSVRVVDALNRSKRIWQAFDLARRYALDKLGELLAKHGQELFESGRWSSFRAAIDSLPCDIRTKNPSVLAIRAYMEHAEGNRANAAALYHKASANAQGDASLKGALLRELTLLYNDNLSDRGVSASAEAITLGTFPERCEARAYHAVALALAGRSDDVRREVRRAIDCAEVLDSPRLLWRIYQQATVAMDHIGEHQRAREFATRALLIAQRLNDQRAIAHVYTQMATTGDHTSRIAYLSRMEDALVDVQDPWLHLFVLSLKYWIASERGDSDWIDYLNVTSSPSGLVIESSLHIQIARAMQLGWRGEFDRAYSLLRATPIDCWQSLYYLRWKATTAIFAALAGQHVAARANLKDVSVHPRTAAGFVARVNNTAAIHAAFAEIFMGERKSAEQRLPVAQFFGEPALCDAVRALADLPANPTRGAVLVVAAELAEREQEGFAALLIAWANAQLHSAGEVRLTESELVVLRRVGDGATAKEIAAETRRSVETVRNHTKSAIRKLGASGRVEAVATARRLGLI